MIYVLVVLVTLMMYLVIRVAFFYSKRSMYSCKAKARVIYFSKEKREVLAAFEYEGIEYGAYHLLVSNDFAQSCIGLFFSKNRVIPSEIDVFFKKGEPENAIVISPSQQVPYKFIIRIILLILITILFVWWKL
ncbi:hypothetical protein [Vibrio harveyi]|uniref:hypothetical protein n=1 Tax=Vibrio harveyi TaxID=669 RepID=UPI003CF85024